MNNASHKLKAAIRMRFRLRNSQASPTERALASAAICERLKQQPIWQHTTAVLFYAPLPDEPDVWPLLPEALSLGKQVALLRHSSSDDSYRAFRITDPILELRPGYFGIREPIAACPPADLKRLDMVLVPGVAFGLNGGRLGRGKGYYDRLLTGIQGWKCGVAFDWQVELEVPTGPRDVRMDCIVTPTRWHEVRHRPMT